LIVWREGPLVIASLVLSISWLLPKTCWEPNKFPSGGETRGQGTIEIRRKGNSERSESDENRKDQPKRMAARRARGGSAGALSHCRNLGRRPRPCLRSNPQTRLSRARDPCRRQENSRNSGRRGVAHCLPRCLTLAGVCLQIDQPAGFITPPIFLTKTSQIRFRRFLAHRKFSAAEKITGSRESSSIFWSR